MRIQDIRLNGKLIKADKTYKAAGWMPVAEASENAGPPVWDFVESYLKTKKVIKPVKPNTPQPIGMAGNPGRGYLALYANGIEPFFELSQFSGTIQVVSEVPSRRSRIRSSVQP